MKQVLSALRAIAGNDDVKDAIVRAGGTESIVAAMTRHLASPQVPTSDTHGQDHRIATSLSARLGEGLHPIRFSWGQCPHHPWAPSPPLL